MASPLIAIVSNDTSLCTRIEKTLYDTGYATVCGPASDSTVDMLCDRNPRLIVVLVASGDQDDVTITDRLEREPGTRTVPMLICSDDQQILPDPVNVSVRSVGPVQASSCEPNELLAKVRQIVPLEA